MDIKNTAIGAKVVIESLICLLENEGVDISSIKFKVGSDSEGYESPKIEFQKLINVTLNELDELKTQVPEGFVLVEKAKLMQIVGSAAIIEPITRGNPLMTKYKTELNFILSTVRAMIEAQEQSHDS